jgi:hypothetical protein
MKASKKKNPVGPCDPGRSRTRKQGHPLVGRALFNTNGTVS